MDEKNFGLIKKWSGQGRPTRCGSDALDISNSCSGWDLLCICLVVKISKSHITAQFRSTILHGIDNFYCYIHCMIMNTIIKVLANVLSKEPVVLSCSWFLASTNTNLKPTCSSTTLLQLELEFSDKIFLYHTFITFISSPYLSHIGRSNGVILIISIHTPIIPDCSCYRRLFRASHCQVRTASSDNCPSEFSHCQDKLGDLGHLYIDYLHLLEPELSMDSGQGL